MTKNSPKTLKNRPRSMLQISEETHAKAAKFCSDLNHQNEIVDEYQQQIARKSGRYRGEKTPKVTIKSFTEAALTYFISAQIDPTAYVDSSLKAEIMKLRNQLFSFNVVQEQKIMNQFSVIDKDISLLNKLNEMGKYETISYSVALLEVMIHVFEIKGNEREKIIDVFKKKLDEFEEFTTGV